MVVVVVVVVVEVVEVVLVAVVAVVVVVVVVVAVVVVIVTVVLVRFLQTLYCTILPTNALLPGSQLALLENVRSQGACQGMFRALFAEAARRMDSLKPRDLTGSRAPSQTPGRIQKVDTPLVESSNLVLL